MIEKLKWKKIMIKTKMTKANSCASKEIKLIEPKTYKDRWENGSMPGDDVWGKTSSWRKPSFIGAIVPREEKVYE